ncbi:hypothetical protein [Microbacterium oxydans]|nr:hypothetical protein [Microbacterium oxydans]
MLHEIVKLGAVFVEMHAGLDEQAEKGCAFENRLRVGKASGDPFSVASGVNAASVGAVRESGVLIAVAGSAIYSADDVGAAAARLRAGIDGSSTSDQGAEVPESANA